MQTGRHTYGHENISILYGEGGELTIGSFCSIAQGVTIYLGGNHRTDWISTYPFGHINQETFDESKGVGHPGSKGNVTIGNDVCISSNVVIMSGVTIGDGAVIVNNSHVVNDVEPYTIVGGNPAKPIRKRFSEESIEKLLTLKWWELEDEVINEISPLLCSPELNELFARFNM